MSIRDNMPLAIRSIKSVMFYLIILCISVLFAIRLSGQSTDDVDPEIPGSQSNAFKELQFFWEFYSLWDHHHSSETLLPDIQ